MDPYPRMRNGSVEFTAILETPLSGCDPFMTRDLLDITGDPKLHSASTTKPLPICVVGHLVDSMRTFEPHYITFPNQKRSYVHHGVDQHINQKMKTAWYISININPKRLYLWHISTSENTLEIFPDVHAWNGISLHFDFPEPPAEVSET